MYTIKINSFGQKVIIRKNENKTWTSFLEEPNNTDYQAYLKWLDEGNTPLPADE